MGGVEVRNRLVLAIILMLSTCGVLCAQRANQQAVGARPAAMGEAFVAVADDGHATYWNPAGLPALQSQEIHTATADLFGTGFKSNYLSYALPFSDRYAAGLDWLRLGFGDEELRFAQNRIGFSSGLKIHQRLSLGASAKWVDIDAGLEGLASPTGFSSRGNGWGLDLGLLVVPLPGFTLGAVVQDLGGTRVEYENGVDRTIHPMNWRLGAAWRPTAKWLLSSGVDAAAHLGGEYRLHPALVLRGGLQRDLHDALGTTFAFGAGVNYRFIQVDYAYAAAPGLDVTHRFSLGLAFSLSASAIKIGEPELQPIFPALQKRYFDQPIGRVKLTNTSKEPLAARLNLFIPDTMLEPTEQLEVVVAPGSETVDLFALFGQQLNDWPRNRMLSAQIQLAYTDGGRTRRTSKQGRLTVYKNNAMQWTGIGAAAAFVTPDDASVASFTSGVLRQFDREVASSGRASRPLLRAMALFDALGIYGMRYLADANTPYQQIGEREIIIDSIQYPAEFLQKKTGDCDDCTALYCSLLENAGISTALIDAPGHILMAFDTGVDRYSIQNLGISESYFIERDGKLWLPVEVTLFGQSFQRAWRTAVAECNQLAADDRLIVVDTKSAWRHYPPSAPALEDREISIPDKGLVDTLFASDWDYLHALRETFLEREYLQQLSNSPGNYPLHSAYVYNLLQLGAFDRALDHLAALEERGAPDQLVWNNRGIIFILQGQFDAAAATLQQLLAAYPQDREARANLEYVQAQQGTVSESGLIAAESESDDVKGEAVEILLEDLNWK
jgi:hypothetical protein